MRLGKIVTLLLAGFLTFSSLNSLAATKSTKTKSSISTHPKKKQATSKTTKKQTAKSTKQAVKNAKKFAKKGKAKVAIKQQSKVATLHSNATRQHLQTGVASYYGDKFNGRRTASGEVFNNAKMTAAHRTLPFGTLIEVTNLRNGRSVVVRVNDRGPFTKGRVVDLSSVAAKKIGMYHSGIANVKIAILNKKSK